VVNISITYTLAPAYDICHAYRPGSPWVSQQSLSVNGKRQDINKTDLLAVAKQMSIKKPGEILQQIENAINEWPSYAQQCQVEEQLRKAIEKTLIRL